MVEPPFPTGVLHDRYAMLLDKNPYRLRGAVGALGASGVLSTTTEGALLPTLFTARTRNLCTMPPVRPVRDKERWCQGNNALRVHVVPASAECST